MDLEICIYLPPQGATQPKLGASLSTDFTPVTMLNGTMYLAGTDGEGNTTLYAVSTTDGSVLWHVSGINQMSPPLAG